MAVARDAAEEANKAKSQFIANMSHELRTPLSAVIGYSEMLEEEVEDLGQSHLLADLEKIKSNARHLLGLINDVLDISKIEANKMEVYVEDFDVAKTIDEVCATVRPLVEKNGNALEVIVSENAGAMRSDVTKLRQVLINFLGNAAKFTKSGTVTLTVEPASSAVDDPRKRILLFRVSDTGLGMSQEQVDKLFQRFTQADASTTRKYGGTGLGLSITKAFADMMGGRVDVQSELGKGSTFTLSVPAELPEPTAGVDDHLGSVNDDSDNIVLVIDDDPSSRDLISRFLVKEGFGVRLAADGRSGLEMAKFIVPRVILLDVTMPRMDGWEVLRHLKADPVMAAIPVVMCTIINEQNLGFSLGAFDYLLKPVDWDRLKEVLARVEDDTAHRTVLIVEDDTDTRARLTHQLSREGWSVIEAENGKIGLEKAAQNRPSVVLLDINMPEMDGFGFLREFRSSADGAAVPVIVMTARDLTAAERAELKGGGARVLSKGQVSLHDLVDQIKRAPIAAGDQNQRPAKAART